MEKVEPIKKDDIGEQDPWIRKVQAAWEVSEDTHGLQMNDRMAYNKAIFDSKHPPGSKFNKPAFKNRSKVFRPKVRSSMRKIEAAAVKSFFGSIDYVNVQPIDESDQNEVMKVALSAEVLKYRLANSMDWYLTCIGALQLAMKDGIVFSFNTWKRRVERTTRQVPIVKDGEMQRDEKGQLIMDTVTEEEVVEDRPHCELLRPDMLRFHPEADWIDPLESSPYVVLERPMYLFEIRARMNNEEAGASIHKKWRKYSDAEILAARIEGRPGHDLKSKDNDDFQGLNDYSMSTVLLWFMTDEKGNKVTFYTLGTKYRLTEPVSLKKGFQRTELPITCGFAVLEAHKNLPSSVPELGRELIKETNDIVNSRLDAAKLAVNKRHLVRRGAQVDTRALMTNAHNIVMVSDTDRDVKEIEYREINNSMYEEQDRLNADMDEALGGFSTSSVNTNRALNETVGGMQMLQGAAGEVADYLLKTFAETWLERTIRQVMRLIHVYENDALVLKIAANKAKIAENFKVDASDIDSDMLGGEMFLTVNVGVGAGNPVFKAQQFISAVKQFAEIMSMGIPGIQPLEVAKELFGYIGYKDGGRFFKLNEAGNVDPQMEEIRAELGKLQEERAGKVVESEAKKALEQIKQRAETERNRRNKEHEENISKAENAARIKIALINARAQLKAEDKKLKATKDSETRRLSHEDVKHKRDQDLRAEEKRAKAEEVNAKGVAQVIEAGNKNAESIAAAIEKMANAQQGFFKDAEKRGKQPIKMVKEKDGSVTVTPKK